MTRLLVLLLVLLGMSTLPTAQAQSMTRQCGAATIGVDPRTLQCVCVADGLNNTTSTDNNDNDNTSTNNDDRIFLAAMFDSNSYTWSPGIVNATIQLLNRGYFDTVQGLPNTTVQVRYEFRNSACDESRAIREYWDVRSQALAAAQAIGTPEALANALPHGILGARCSGPSTTLAGLTGLEGIPQLSPTSNTARLSDDAIFPLFGRLVAPNNEQGEVGGIVALMRSFGWERVTILLTDATYSKDMVTEFQKVWTGEHNDASGRWKGSIAYSETIPVDTTTGLLAPAAIRQALHNVPVGSAGTTTGRVVFLVAHPRHAWPILQMAEGLKAFPDDTVWVGPSAWAGREVTNEDGSDPANPWLPNLPGYFGIAPFLNRNEHYQNYMQELRQFQLDTNSPELLDELPAFAGETVDAIVALAKALAAAPDRRDGPAVVRAIRNLDFEGVSGRVQFTASGDRRNPQYSILNAVSRSNDGNNNNNLVWQTVGTVSSQIGSVVIPDPDRVCFRGFGCGVDPPEDTYQDLPRALTVVPLWVYGVLACMAVALFLLAFKYWTTNQKKNVVQAELKAFQKSIVGMRAAQFDCIPQVMVDTNSSNSGSILNSSNDGSTGLDGYRSTLPPSTKLTAAPSERTASSTSSGGASAEATWCWKETEGNMKDHPDSAICGSPEDCWIKYDPMTTARLEAAYQQGSPSTVTVQDCLHTVQLDKMVQTHITNGFRRRVLRVDPPINKESLRIAGRLPPDLIGEPQMVLVQGDMIQISRQRDDGWAFGTKLRHADENAARQLLNQATTGVDADKANVFTDTGWLQLEATRVPTSKDLAGLVETVGTFDAGSLQPPSHWEFVQDPTVAQKHELLKGHPEREAVVSSFLSTLQSDRNHRVKVIKVERVQNLGMYQTYVVKRSTICYRETGQDHASEDDDSWKKTLERFERTWLWHGTSVEGVGKIINQGFNRSYCGRNDSVFGKGVYFARDASYSATEFFASPDAKGRQYMLACRVCVGEYCRGRHDAVVPPVRDPKTHALYDSTVGLLRNDTMDNPSVYVTYQDAQAYPEYLITFQKSPRNNP